MNFVWICLKIFFLNCIFYFYIADKLTRWACLPCNSILLQRSTMLPHCKETIVSCSRKQRWENNGSQSSYWSIIFVGEALSEGRWAEVNFPHSNKLTSLPLAPFMFWILHWRQLVIVKTSGRPAPKLAEPHSVASLQGLRWESSCRSCSCFASRQAAATPDVQNHTATWPWAWIWQGS